MSEQEILMNSIQFTNLELADKIRMDERHIIADYIARYATFAVSDGSLRFQLNRMAKWILDGDYL